MQGKPVKIRWHANFGIEIQVGLVLRIIHGERCALYVIPGRPRMDANNGGVRQSADNSSQVKIDSTGIDFSVFWYTGAQASLVNQPRCLQIGLVIV